MLPPAHKHKDSKSKNNNKVNNNGMRKVVPGITRTNHKEYFPLQLNKKDQQS